MQQKLLGYRGYRANNAGYQTAANKRWTVVRLMNSGYTGPKVKVPKGGILPIHPFAYNIYDYTMKVDNIHTDGKNWVRGDNLSINTYGLDLPDLGSTNNLYNAALSELNEKTRGSLDLSIDIAEMGQTARMMKLTDQLVDFTRTFRRRYGTLKSAANAWLQYTYGVRPLLSSIHGVADEIDRFVLNKTARFRVMRTEMIDMGRFGYYSASNLYSYIPAQNRKVKRTCTLGCIIDQRDRDISRLTSLNPLSIAWELTPYSFVVDWFYNVGDYLRNIETSLLYANRFRSGYVSYLTACEGSIDYWTTPTTNGYNTRMYGDYRYVSFGRSVMSSYPAPRLPSFQANLGSSRMLSAAALLSTLLRR